MTENERGDSPNWDDDADEEVLQASLAAAMSAGDQDRIAVLQDLLADPQRSQIRAARREFGQQYDRHVRHKEAHHSGASDDE